MDGDRELHSSTPARPAGSTRGQLWDLHAVQGERDERRRRVKRSEKERRAGKGRGSGRGREGRGGG